MKRRFDTNILILLALPVLLLLINKNWIFTRIGRVDAWIYYGYFLNFAQNLQLFDTLYYGTRLSWIIPGFIVHHLFPPLVANYVLHLSLYYIAVLSLYSILKQLTSERAALFSAIGMGTYPFFLFAIGWNNIDAAGITWFFITILCLTRAAKSSFFYCRIWLLLGGMALTAFMYVNTFLVMFTPFLALYYMFLNQQHHKHSVPLSILLGIAGFLCANLIFMVVMLVYQGNVFFVWTIIKWSLIMSQNPDNWKHPISSWLPYATHLVVPLIVWIIALIVSLVQFQRKTSSTLLQFLCIWYMCIGIFMVLMQIQHYGILEFPYYSSYIMPSMFLAIGSLIEPILKPLTPSQFRLVIGAMIVFLGLPLFPMLRSPIVPLLAERIIVLYPLVVLFFSVCCLWLIRNRMVGLIVFFASVTMCSIFISMPQNTSFYHHLDYPKFDYEEYTPEELLLTVSEGMEIVSKLDNNDILLFWYSTQGSRNRIYEALSASRLGWWRRINGIFPVLHDSSSNTRDFDIKKGLRIVILSDGKNTFAKAQRSFADEGWKLSLFDEKVIEQGNIRVVMTVVDVVDRENVSLYLLTKQLNKIIPRPDIIG